VADVLLGPAETDTGSNPAQMEALNKELDKASSKLADSSKAFLKASQYLVKLKGELDKLNRWVLRA
jgi:hypothetical protein